MWTIGWQPADVERVVCRRLGVGHAIAAVGAIAAQHRRYAAATVDRAWRDQLRAIGADPWAPAGAPPSATADRHRTLIEILALLRGLPPLPRLLPLPGRARSSTGTTGALDIRVLERVRAMLAKAESTTFAEEAEAFTAKAQELMAHHAVDRAMLDGARPAAGPEGRRIGVDDPYARAKSLLLAQVAAANRCRAVWTPDLGFSTIFGHQPGLDGVELLYTSLLVQAVAAMAAACSQVDHRGRSRTRSFRMSFLVAYAQRIGQRLRESAEAAEVAATAEHGAGLVPVLARRDRAVDDVVGASFPRLRRHTVSVTNGAGWMAGTAAAELARLSPHEAVERNPASA
ncbi:MAG TPA: DUF2786 domain-containing protein [Acidimicrobiales bacterium]|nr:DUF2786 domain-containing protein [Acidimicrobiales bacterium]